MNVKDTAIRSSLAGSQQQEASNNKSVYPEAKKGLHHLFIVELKDIYWAEKILSKAILKMAKNTVTPELIDIFTSHLHTIRKHVPRLEKVFYSIGEEPMATKYEAMSKLIKEAELIIGIMDKGKVKDAELIAAYKKIELYKITTYGILSYFAQTLGEDDASKILQGILNEENIFDDKLSEVALSFINYVEAAGTD